MADFDVTNFGKVGLGYANWRKYLNFDKDNPFYQAQMEQPKTTPAVVPPVIDASVPTPNYGIPPKMGTFGTAPSFGLSSTGGGTSVSMPSLDDEIENFFKIK